MPDDFETLENEVLAALATHQRWRAFVREARDIPRETALTVASLERCPISAWLDERMPQPFRAIALYNHTQAAHRAFHRAVDLVAEGRSDGSFPRAATLLKSYLDEWLTYSRVR